MRNWCRLATKLSLGIQEIKAGMIELMKQRATFANSEIQDGDVICYQVEMTEKE